MQRNLSWIESALAAEGLLVSARLFDRSEAPWFGACIDTRGDCANRVFFALRGEKTDGHRFLSDAASKGAVACVAEDEEAVRGLGDSSVPYLVVTDALRALQELARAYRNTLGLRVIAVTGSMGKTTTKEYIRGILKKKYRVHSNPGNLNNHIGVPLTVLETGPDGEYLACEIAANHVGEIEFLSRLLRPDVGVITNIGDAHIGYFGGRENIARAKSEIFAGIDADGSALLPGDDEFIELLRRRAACRVVTFGRDESSTYRITDVAESEAGFSFRVNGEPAEIHGIAVYNVANATAAWAVGELCGVEADRIRAALLEAEPLAGRSRLHRGGGVVLVDDSYNANPTSMRAALESFLSLRTMRKIVVLGDMAELGEYSEEAHREIGRYLAGRPVDAVYWYGESGGLVEAGLSGRQPRFEWHTELDELIRALSNEVRPGDGVLIKASRAAHLDRVVDALVTGIIERGEG